MTVGLRQAKLVVKPPNIANRKEVLDMNRAHLSKLAALVTGHGAFKYHLKVMGVAEDDTCRLCLEDSETAIHIICECPALARARRNVLGTDLICISGLRDIPYKKLIALTRDISELWER